MIFGLHVAAGRVRFFALFLFAASAPGGILLVNAASAAGTTATWGLNNVGQLGDSTMANTRRAPVAIVDANNVLTGKTLVQISAGDALTCAAASDGAAYCWGNNSNGELGNASTSLSTVPAAVNAAGVLSGKAVTQLSVGAKHSCAVTSDGGAYCWGWNGFGQSGNNSVSDSNVPVAVDMSGALAGKSVVQISAGVRQVCATTSDGGAYCWGYNASGQLGDNTTINHSAPVAVDKSGALAGKLVVQISTGDMHSCAVTSDGGAYCWGSNQYGQLGDGTTNNRLTPVSIDMSGALAGKVVTQVSVGDTYTCAVTSDGGAYCWGYGGYGQLGNIWSLSSAANPMQVYTAGRNFTQIAAGPEHACAVTSDGAAYCWGENGAGELGVNTNISQQNVPAAVYTSGVLSGTFMRQVAAGGFNNSGHSAAIAPACGAGVDLTSGTSAQWHAFALPQASTANPATAVNVFGTGTASNLDSSKYGVANPAAGTGWVMYRRNPATGVNVQLTATDLLVPGEGYWIKSFQKTRTGKLFVDCQNSPPTAPVTQAQGCASANGCVAVSVTTTRGAGRVLLGQPFPWNTDWSAVRVRVNGSPATYTPSQAAGLTGSGDASPPVLGNAFWVWNGTSYDSFSDSGSTQGSLKLQKSFWVDVLAGASGKTVELLIPVDPSALMQ